MDGRGAGPQRMTELWQLSASELVAAFRAGDATPTEALESCLSRIATCDAAVGAFTALDEDRACAAALDPVGPLGGVPVGVKELIEVEGLPYTGGSATRTGRVGRRDAAVVRSLREAGAVVVGTTRTHELAWGITTQHETLGGTHNPWRLDRVPGGSSGGSAAAVAYGGVPVALGTDTGGSIRIPAGFCGVVGFKPSYGLLPTDGVLPLAPSFDHVGVLAREVGDVRLAVGMPRAAASEPPRLGTPAVAAAIPLAPAVRAALDAGLETLGGARPVEWPDPADAYAVFSTLQLTEALAVHRDVLRTWPDRAEDYGSDVRSRLERAETVSAEESEAAGRALTELSRRAEAVFDGVDVVIQPTTAAGPSTIATPAVTVSDGRTVPFRDVTMPCTVVHDMAGLPACSVPAGLDDDGIPIGLQITAESGRDALVLDVAERLRDALRSRLPTWPTGLPG
jgi:aspartyl-tRNA(Asn)/glutamyl-tRNA(Gln) amidotransferase subunit A